MSKELEDLFLNSSFSDELVWEGGSKWKILNELFFPSYGGGPRNGGVVKEVWKLGTLASV